ncbi:MAG: formyl transferase [Planctomycetota bacterium]
MHAQPSRSNRSALRLGILTSVETRHRYFVQALRSRFDAAAVGYEQTGYDPSAAPDLTPEESRIVENHFAERSRQEQIYFGGQCEFVPETESCAVRLMPPGRLNSPATLDFLESHGVNTLVVYGTNLIRTPLLEGFAGRIINLHLGLSPYYRGTATNFYPLLNEEPEYVGATIHLIDAGIDSGPILKHARPTIVADDGPHTIGCKAIAAGLEAMIAVLNDLSRGTLKPVPQWKVPNARLYLRKNYHPRQVVELYRKHDDGLIRRYVERAAKSPPPVRLIL